MPIINPEDDQFDPQNYVSAIPQQQINLAQFGSTPSPNSSYMKQIDPVITAYLAKIKAQQSRPMQPTGNPIGQLQDYVKQNEQQTANQTTPEYMGLRDKNAVASYFAGLQPNMMAGYNSAGAQLGTLHGVVSDTSAPYLNAQNINKQQQGLAAQNLANQQGIDKQTGLRLNTLQYLAGLQEKNQMPDNNMSLMLKQAAAYDPNNPANKAKVAAEKPPTATQAGMAILAKELSSARDDVRAAMDSYDPSSAMMEQNPLYPNLFMSPEAQRYQQAVNRFTDAALKLKSGKASTAQEVQQNAAIYTPGYGDDSATRNQKLQSMDQMVENAKAMAGGAYGQIPTAPNPELPPSQPKHYGSGAPQNQTAPNSNPQSSNVPEGTERRTKLGPGSYRIDVFKNGNWIFDHFDFGRGQ